MSEQLYRFYDADGGLLYVGISKSAIKRMTEHANDKPWWTDVRTMTVERLAADRAGALEIERQVIINERPLHNVIHNGEASSGATAKNPNQASSTVAASHPMLGRYVLIPCSDDGQSAWRVQYQGQVTGAISDTMLIVDLFSWWDGSLTNSQVFDLCDGLPWRVFKEHADFIDAGGRALRESMGVPEPLNLRHKRHRQRQMVERRA